MQNLIDFIVKYKHWFVFFLMEGFCLALLFRFNNYQGSVFFTTANSFVGGIYSAVDGVTSYVGLNAANRQLEAENALLREEVHEMKRELAARRIDTLQFEGFNRSRYRFVSAQIVNATTNHSLNLLTLNKGKLDGIKPEMGVICSSGVVGIVFLTSDRYSVVMPLINVKSKVSCQLKDHQSFGTMEWEFGDCQYANMTGLPLHIKADVGEIVETNGHSDIFPSGIPLGQVERMGHSDDGLSQKLTVKLAVDFSSVHNVSVITNYHHAEKRTLEFLADSLMTLE